MGIISRIIKRHNCKHDNVKCMTTFYDDCITRRNYVYGKIKHTWICKECGKIFKKEK